MKFFNIDLHISVIADIKHIFENLGHQVDSKCLSGHSWVFGKQPDKTKIIDSHNWKQIDEVMCDRFYEEYGGELDQYDAFISAYPPAFGLLFEKFNKPIITVAATRYEYPFTFDSDKWKKLNTFLSTNKNVIRIANNLFDKYYCELFTEVNWDYIPSLCEYTQEKYNPNNEQIVLFTKQKQITGTVDKSSLGRYTWKNLFENKAIAHIPYNYSTMSIFEQYTANIPLLFPDKNYLLQLFLKNQAMSEISFRQVFSAPPKSELDVFCDPNCYNNISTFVDNLEYADFYNQDWMPHITYFKNDDEFLQLKNNLNFEDISNKMKEKNTERKNVVYERWKSLLKSI